MRHPVRWMLGMGMVLLSCGSVKQYETPQQQLQRPLSTHVGGIIFELETEESLPNVFGRADIYGGRRPTGFVQLKYLGLGEAGQIKLRVLSTDIETNENWRRRFGREGHVTSTSDAVDFEHDPEEPFEIEGYVIQFLDAQPARVSYRILKSSTARRTSS